LKLGKHELPRIQIQSNGPTTWSVNKAYRAGGVHGLPMWIVLVHRNLIRNVMNGDDPVNRARATAISAPAK
jgi:hypothetical protein